MEPPATEFKPCSVKALPANIADRVRCVAQIKGVQQALSVSLQSDYCVLASSVDVNHKAFASFQTFLSVCNCEMQHSLIG